MFSNYGISGFFAYVIATLEVVGGAALVLGLETKIFAALFGIQMIVATLYVSWEKGLINGFEIDLLLFACCVHLTMNGSSWLSLDNVFHGGRRRVRSEEA
ncbi:DoxX family protein [Paenibacillus algorifonticola]|uniref:DoxX family protein n=1 Tax=Paenibacillus algorifonticola TaxID=684063 RepID=UPI003D283278